MDELDFRIIAELFRAPFAAHAQIGKTLGRTGTAVKLRLDEMIRRGLISSFLVVPSAPALRRVQKIFPFRNVNPEPPLEEILAVDNVVAVARGSPGMLLVNTFDLDASVAPPSRLVGVVGGTSERATLTDTPVGAENLSSALSPLDWRVILALLEDPRASLSDLARKARLTPTTVRRRRDALIRDGLLHVSPIVDTRREPGLIAYSGYLWLLDRSVADSLEWPGLASTWIHHDPPGVSIFGACPNFAAVEELEQELRSTQGVRAAELTASRGGVLAVARIRMWIRTELEWWSGSRDIKPDQR